MGGIQVVMRQRNLRVIPRGFPTHEGRRAERWRTNDIGAEGVLGGTQIERVGRPRSQLVQHVHLVRHNHRSGIAIDIKLVILNVVTVRRRPGS